MNYQKTTMIPNALFDTYLNTLSLKELKVLLVIFRQTLGWIDATGRRKEKDWISHRYFVRQTGLSRKSITKALALLAEKKLVRIEYTTTSHTNSHAQRNRRTFYSYGEVFTPRMGTFYPYKGKKGYPTKLTETKLKKAPQRLSDYERLKEIFAQQKKNPP